jgi:oligopeptide/dipeptide ABC transporter ATP-binding protein
LVAARPHIDGDVTRLAAIPGRPRSAYEAPAGCAFSDRCAFTQEACTADRPALVPFEDGLVRCVRAGELRHELRTEVSHG